VVSTPPDSFPDEQGSQEPEQVTGQEHPDERPTVETPEEEPSTSETALPPEAQGETNGGPLGCCLGTVSGLFLTVLLTTGIPLLIYQHALPGNIAFPLALVGALICGVLGWRIGKRVYREYELSPRQKQKLEAWEKRKEQQKAAQRSRKRK
jgi:hypothetical protein